MGAVRFILRLPLLLLHILVGTPATVLAFYRPFRGIRVSGEPLRDVMLRWWGRTACRIFGARVHSSGSFRDGPQLIVANHISWLDTQLLHSLSPMGFVAKSEIESWPVAGFVARVGGTVFHRRGSHDSASGVTAAMASRLEEGGKVAIFPEGGVLPGFGVKRFHARLFAAAIDTGSPVQPVAIRYMRDGRHFKDMTFRKGETFIANILRLLTHAPLDAEVLILEPISSFGMARRDLALQAEIAVRDAFESGGEPEHA
ncbi:MAG: lysophospholipid acyltransferase family protein [Xanthomonadales bacterium]|nr:lysophospholipid acyltransferase family protein [Xanthomonadales bacterium]